MGGAATAWKLIAPAARAVRDMLGKGDDPAMREILVQVAANTKLLCDEVVPSMRSEFRGLREDVIGVKASVDHLDGRLTRVEKLTPGLTGDRK